jgi:hypothetical protein
MTGRDKGGQSPEDDGKTRRSRRRRRPDDDDCEDGDMTTPKQDRHGNDDEPLE